MSKLVFLAVAFVILLVSAGLFFGQHLTNQKSTDGQSATAPCKDVKDTEVVEMSKDAFLPESLTIQKCTKVVFKNVDDKARWPASDLHPTHGIYPEFDPKEPIDPGKEWSFVFDRVGKWRYHDHLSPYIRGTVVVSE